MSPENNIIVNKTGTGVPISAIAISLLFGVLGIVVSIDVPVIGLPISFVFFGIAGNRTGVKIDLQNQKFMRYSTFWFRRFGKWRSLNAYKNLSIKINVEGNKLQFAETPMGPNVYTKFYDVVFVHKNMHDTIVISRHKNKKNATLKLREFVDITGKPYISLNPNKNPILKERRLNRR